MVSVLRRALDSSGLATARGPSRRSRRALLRYRERGRVFALGHSSAGVAKAENAQMDILRHPPAEAKRSHDNIYSQQLSENGYAMSWDSVVM